MLIPFDDLFAHYKIKPTGVLHLGANLGQEAPFYFKQGCSPVIWVEALPDLCQKLRSIVSLYPGSIVLEACLGDKEGEMVSFNVASNGGQSSSYLEFGTHSKEHPSVVFTRKIEMKTTRLDTLLDENEIKVGPGWFLNIDLQGAELKALEGMGVLIYQFKYAYIEVNEKELYKGCPLVGEIDAYMARFGFVAKETKMTGSGWGDKFFIRD